MKTVGISIGGRVVSKEGGINISYIRGLSELLKRQENGYRFVLVVGGGYANRLAVSSARKEIKSNYVLDEIGIWFTRINALMLKNLLSSVDVYPNVVADLTELKAAMLTDHVVVMGGLVPGITTDGVCALACEAVNSNLLINVSTLGHVYDKLPSEKGAKPLKKMNHAQLVEMAYRYDSRVAKSDFIFDLFASKLTQRSNIEIHFVNDKIKDLEMAITGKSHEGTVVKD